MILQQCDLNLMSLSHQLNHQYQQQQLHITQQQLDLQHREDMLAIKIKQFELEQVQHAITS